MDTVDRDISAPLPTLEFRGRPHLDAYQDAVLGAILVAAGVTVIALTYDSLWAIFVSLLVMYLGGFHLVWAAYAFRGRLVIDCDRDGWFTVTSFLGRLRRSKRFSARMVRIVEDADTGPTAWVVQLELAWPRRFIHIGDGFDLNESEREAIKQMLWRAKDLYQ